MEDLISHDEASQERDKQRSESEARDIIHDLERLYTTPDSRKTRWVWELLQNAKDVATPAGVNVILKLSPEKLLFAHNGYPFKTNHLLAILYKTSTKSLNGEGGTTGKYGTGFVTTHVLNKKLNINGVHIDRAGQDRRFQIEIDRTAANLPEDKALQGMQESLKATFKAISDIAKAPVNVFSDRQTTFTYNLTPDTYKYAEIGISELESNAIFTLLINPAISSISIENPSNQKIFILKKEETNLKGIKFCYLDSGVGLLYHNEGKLTFGIPAKRSGSSYSLLPIENQAILFKEFPLIGTEGFNLPVFIQHEDFHPTELRDAIRCKIISDLEEDATALKNRIALINFVNAYLFFVETIIDTNLEGKHLLAKSGLPDLIDIYFNRDWYQSNIQLPVRDLILSKKVVSTCSGLIKTIPECKFILQDCEYHKAFYDLASWLIPDQIADAKSIWQWAEIIYQDEKQWPSGLTLTIVDLAILIPTCIDLNHKIAFDWLNEFYNFLSLYNLNYLGDKYPIYPNETGEFCRGNELVNYPEIDEQFKIVASGLGRILDKEFLNRKIGIIQSIENFDLTEFFKNLNFDLIQQVKVDSASETQIKSILHVCCLYRSGKAYRRESWFSILNQLLPEVAAKRLQVSVDYENYGRSAEIWSIKYISYLIQKSGKPTSFAGIYFDNNYATCFQWLNNFLSFIFSINDEFIEGVLKMQIIPTQGDVFRPYDDDIFAELDSRYFDEAIKNIFRDFTKNGDPRNSIIDTRITASGIRRKDVEVLTKEIDKLFHDENIERKIKKGGEWNEMFMQLNDWYEQFPISETLLPTFYTKRASLYVLALGEGFSKQIMEIQNSGKSIEDIKNLAKIQLTTTQMQILDHAASELGAGKLLAKAEEMLDAKRQIERWKTIGTAAEIAFYNALSNTEPRFKILNPDIGKDFVIIANGKEYAIEIKSVDASKGNVNMSLLQGETSVKEKNRYALCVLSRPEDGSEVDDAYFIDNAQFVADIGYQIGNSIDLWNHGILSLDTRSDVKVSFDEKTESVYVSRTIWKNGVSFEQFISVLQAYFAS